MAYVPTVWETGDVITAEKLNKAEEGIQAANADVLLVSVTPDSDPETLDKKFSEIFGAYPKVLVTTEPDGTLYSPLAGFYIKEGAESVYSVLMTDGTEYRATTEDGYPVKALT